VQSSSPTLFILAGPNGAGKSTFSKKILSPFKIESFDYDSLFDNQWKRFGYDPLVKSGVADSISSQFSEELNKALSNKENYAYETNFHSEGNFEIIKNFIDKGFEVVIYFLYINNIEKCQERVKLRVEKGGHFVSDEEISFRYSNGLSNIKKAINFDLKIYFYDMSEDDKQSPVLFVKKGKISINENCTISLLKELGFE